MSECSINRFSCTILVPVYNEGQVFHEWFPRLLSVVEQLEARVVVVDDGSDQSMVSGQWSMGNQHDVTILRHDVNCGVGAALGTGLSYIKRNGGGVVMTIDGDGQHNPEDLRSLMHFYLQSKSEVVANQNPISEALNSKQITNFKHQQSNGMIINGSRFLKKQSIPWFRRLVNKLANVIAFALSGFWVTDSQSGMKLLSPEVVESVELETPGYEWCLDVMREAGHKGWSIQEIPISVLYNSYSLNKGQHFALGLDMVMKLVLRSLSRPFRSFH